MHHFGSRSQNGGRRTPAAALDLEIAQEMASALGRLGRRLEAALRALAEYDAAGAADDGSPADAGPRLALVLAAADAYWCFLVQRESCGLFDAQAVLAQYRVPAEVQRHAGAAPAVRLPVRTRWRR
jgi:hypothetical protein